MLNSKNARSTADNSRQPSATSGDKFRAPSSQSGTRERPLSFAEVIPDDSASNGPGRRSASGAQKINGSIKISERKTGRVHLATRENLQVRTRSPVKSPLDDGIEDGGPKQRTSTRQSGLVVEGQAKAPRKEKKASREYL